VREVRVTGKQDAFINKTIRKIKIRDIDWFTVTWQSTVKLWQNKNSDALLVGYRNFLEII
jgi:hypothetical protein